MSSTTRVSLIKDTYNPRADVYDDGTQGNFHRSLADDLIKAAHLQPGATVLDLACGTGLVTIPAKEAVGPHGTVIGIDVAAEFMAVGMKKRSPGGEIRWIEHDVQDLSGVEGLEKGSVDVIFCCSAFVLLRPPFEKVLEGWAEYLKPGGLILFDVPGAATQLTHLLAEEVINAFGLELFWHRRWIKSEESVRELITAAGGDLEVVDVFTTPAYNTFEWTVGDGETTWEGLLKQPLCTLGELKGSDAGRAKEMYLKLWAERADKDGRIVDPQRLHVGVAKRLV